MLDYGDCMKWGSPIRDRKLVIAASAALLAVLAVAAPHPSAKIEILTHDTADTTPHRVKAAVDLGIVAISVLVTWTAKRIG